jgi:RimJ/RimL family protein N-acetyltransferase
MTDPPYRIVTERTVVRCWDPRDASALKDAIDSSLDDLRPWLAWAYAEPKALAEKVALLRRFRGRFDLGREFVYGIFTADESAVLRGTGLHTRSGDDAFEIGYWIRSGHAGRGLCTEATAALKRVAFELCGVDRVEIRVDPENGASLAIPRKLGYVEEATLRRRLPPHGNGAPRDVMHFALFRDGFARSPAASILLHAYDALDDRVL